MSGRFWICAACGAETVPGPECTACGAEPRLFGAYTLWERLTGDGRGAVYAGTAEEGAPVRVRVATLPEGDEGAAAAWDAAARAWQRFGHADIAPPLGAGLVGSGRFARIEAVVEGKPLRVGAGIAGALAALERLLDIVAALHEAGVAHGGIRPEAVVRRADGLLVLTDFSPVPAEAADDLPAVAAVARALTQEALPPSVAALLSRLEGDRAHRPSAAAAREIVHQARAARPGTTPGVALTGLAPTTSGPRASLVVLLGLALLAGAAFWWFRLTASSEWEGTLEASVARIEGTPPVRVGQACLVEIASAHAGSDNCRITVTCGEERLFGGGEYGMARCVGEPPRAEDPEPSAEDGDPALELAADQQVLRIWDERASRWLVELRLEVW